MMVRFAENQFSFRLQTDGRRTMVIITCSVLVFFVVFLLFFADCFVKWTLFRFSSNLSSLKCVIFRVFVVNHLTCRTDHWIKIYLRCWLYARADIVASYFSSAQRVSYLITILALVIAFLIHTSGFSKVYFIVFRCFVGSDDGLASWRTGFPAGAGCIRNERAGTSQNPGKDALFISCSFRETGLNSFFCIVVG